jgi:hypothetical protein
MSTEKIHLDRRWQKLLDRFDAHAARIVKQTVVDVSESIADKSRRIEYLEQEYTRWFEYHFGHLAKYKCAKYHAELAALVINNPKSKVLAEIYRSGAKSIHADLGIPLYLYLVKRDLFYMLLIGQTEFKAAALLSDLQAELMYNSRLKNDYGERYQAGDWSNGYFLTTDGVRFTAMGFGQDTRGVRQGAARPDYISVDDVDSKKHVNNSRIMQESVDYIMEDVMGCFDAADNSTERFIYCNNNYHKNSITNRLKAEFKNNYILAKQKREISEYVVFTVNAVKNLETFEPSWPEKTSAAYWRKKYEKKPSRFLREYMNTHVVDGKLFQTEWMRWKTPLPLGDYDSLCLYGDLSYKEQGDYKAMVLCGKKNREIHFLHCYLRQGSRRDAAKWLYDLYEDKSLREYNVIYMIEGLFAQDEFISDFDEEGDDRGYIIPVEADKRTKANKYDRIEITIGFFQRSFVFWNTEEKESPDQVAAIDQYLAFEKGSQAHDDFPDCAHGAIDQVNRGSYRSKAEPKTIKRQLPRKHDH